MTDHLPECAQQSVVRLFFGDLCICAALRACEHRTLQQARKRVTSYEQLTHNLNSAQASLAMEAFAPNDPDRPTMADWLAIQFGLRLAASLLQPESETP